MFEEILLKRPDREASSTPPRRYWPSGVIAHGIVWVAAGRFRVLDRIISHPQDRQAGKVIVIAVLASDLLGDGAERLVDLALELEAVGPDTDFQRLAFVLPRNHRAGHRQTVVGGNAERGRRFRLRRRGHGLGRLRGRRAEVSVAGQFNGPLPGALRNVAFRQRLRPSPESTLYATILCFCL
jgi:hypothetical protein